MQFFNIQIASKLSGVAATTIRAWEKRYKAVIPERGNNGHRLYSENDIEKLALLHQLTEIGQSIGQIAPLDLDELKSIFKTLMHEPYKADLSANAHLEKFDYLKTLSSILLALVNYKVDIIAHELDKARYSMSPRQFAFDIILPFIHERQAQLTMAQEQTMRSLLSFHAGTMISSHYQQASSEESMMLLGTPEGDFQEMGILIAALLCVHYGIRFIYLGTNLPACAFAEAANSLNSKVILLSASGIDLKAGLNLNQFMQSLQNSLNDKTAIWINGNQNESSAMDFEKVKILFFPTFSGLDEFFSHASKLRKEAPLR